MKIPQEIKNKMRKIAKLSKQAADLSREIDNFFEDEGYDIEDLRSGDGISLEELELGNDITEKFCKWFETEYTHSRKT